MVDRWLSDLLVSALAAEPGGTGVALVAVGGFGRQELCPGSDLDVVLVHDRKAPPASVARIAERIWYPIWDQGFHLGHTVGTVRQVLAVAGATLATATSLLSARHLAGEADLSVQVLDGARRDWEKRASRVLAELAAGVMARHRHAGDAAFRLEPDLKEARGGLRDVHALAWAQAARAVLLDYDEPALASAYGVLLDARVELQRRTGRPGNVLVLEEQDGVAQALGLAGADELMGRVARAARSIAWTSDDTWRRVASTLRGPVARGGQRSRVLDAGVVLRDGEVTLDAGAVPADDPTLVLRVARAAARHGAAIERHALERLAAETPAPAPALPEPWRPGVRALLVDLLSTGRPAIAVIEALDQRGVWEPILPEWREVRSRPQRNAYHRFTVDRHLLETAANASGLSERVERPDLLVLGALLHDLGKGHPDDHCVVGATLAGRIGVRMGLPDQDVATLEALVRHHLLLADVAARRDLDDPVTIGRVARTVETVERLRLLAALTEADSVATGPSAWGPWKAGLLATLVGRIEAELTGESPPPAPRATGGTTARQAEQAGHAALLADGSRHIVVAGDVLTVITDDRPGVFSRVAGVLALHGLDVVAASAQVSPQGRAWSEFRVTDPVGDAIAWPAVVAAVDKALDGRLALAARLAERRRLYDRPGVVATGRHGTAWPGRTRTPSGEGQAAARVRFDNAASDDATVVDVFAEDRIGVLYGITRALTELDLDIRSARVQALGSEGVDSFYLRDREGQKITDAARLAEIERAVLHALAP